MPTAVAPMFCSARPSAACRIRSLRAADRQRVRGELLAEADGHRVLEVGAARLEDAVEATARSANASASIIERASSSRMRSSVATRMAVGKVSLVDWAMFTWSLGLTTP